MTQRLDCGPFGMAVVDEEKVVVRRDDLTLAPASGKIERSADAFPVHHHRTSWGKTKSCTRNIAGRPAEQGMRQWQKLMDIRYRIV